MTILYVLFWLSAFIIVWAMLGYKFSLKVLGRVFKNRELNKDFNNKPKVSVMIVAHNEEKVIYEKLQNVIDNDYPSEKIEYIVASDFSTDNTNNIVQKFINENPNLNIKLYQSKEHKGKTNAQNEAQKITTGEILVMTDANALFQRSAISELVSSFSSEDIAYVTGRLSYKNATDNDTASSESTYWESDLEQRKIESNIKTITAGNGAIYACKNALYYDFDPIKCHDSSMPYYYAGKHLRAIYNQDAVAYEKAGEITGDEFKRKVRMNRIIIQALKAGFKSLNVFKYGWFSYFFFGHRTCRYLLWITHAILYAASIGLYTQNGIYKLAFWGQTIFYVLAIFNLKIKSGNKLLNLMSYYTMTIFAQWKGVIDCVTGKSKPTWEKAESTR